MRASFAKQRKKFFFAKLFSDQKELGEIRLL
jgi:hypothetical protein